MTSPHDDPTCDVAHNGATAPSTGRTLVAVFASPVADYLLRYGRDTGFRAVLIEPDAALAQTARNAHAAQTPHGEQTAHGEQVMVATSWDGCLDETADVVVTDHHRPELGTFLWDALASKARWVGIMGNPHHPAPHIPALAALGVPAAEIARVHRPIGLNIGSHSPAEIAIATLAGLIADRNGRPGGFSHL